jgi:cytidylate kinase/5'(3')-deoxyribonucleotidase
MKTTINKITLSGEVASGKSTIGKILANRLNYEFQSIGNKTRLFAEKNGQTIVQFQKECINNPELDKKIDLEFSKECNSSNNLIIDYRMGFHFIKEGYHVFLKISEENAIERLQKVERKNETYHTVKERNDSFKTQFISAYGIDYTDEKNYDLIIEVSKYSNPNEIVDAILDGFELKKRKEILYIDLDGVVCDFDKAINDVYPDLKYLSIVDKELSIENIIRENPSFFENLPPYEGAIDAVKKLFNLYDVYFLSTPMWSIPESYKGKRIWIEKYFGQLSKKRLILTHRKDLVIGNYLVDDRLMHGSEKFNGKHIHFATNKFPDWKNTLSYLESVA